MQPFLQPPGCNSLFCNASPTPVGRDALAQLRATSDSAAVSETETETVAQSIAKPTAPVAADHLREAAKMIQTPTFAEVRFVRPASAIPAVASVAPEPSESETVAGPLKK